MELSQALGIINLTDTVTLRKRKLPLESMVWLVIGMAIRTRLKMQRPSVRLRTSTVNADTA